MQRLNRKEILIHPYIIGELALGYLASRAEILGLLHDLPQADVASDGEVIDFIEAAEIFGTGIGYIDAHLLASAKLRPGTLLWTRDRRLSTVAARLQLAVDPPH